MNDYNAVSAFTTRDGLVHRAFVWTSAQSDGEMHLSHVASACQYVLGSRDHWRLDPTKKVTCLRCLAEVR